MKQQMHIILYLICYLSINTQQSPSEVCSLPASQENFFLFWNSKVHCLFTIVHKKKNRFANHFILVHTIINYILKLHLNISAHSRVGSPRNSITSRQTLRTKLHAFVTFFFTDHIYFNSTFLL